MIKKRQRKIFRNPSFEKRKDINMWNFKFYLLLKSFIYFFFVCVSIAPELIQCSTVFAFYNILFCL